MRLKPLELSLAYAGLASPQRLGLAPQVTHYSLIAYANGTR